MLRWTQKQWILDIGSEFFVRFPYFAMKITGVNSNKKKVAKIQHFTKLCEQFGDA